jgi:DNA-binding response OmpR family regulator
MTEAATQKSEILAPTPAHSQILLTCGDLVIDRRTQKVTKAGIKLPFSPTEFELLAYLVEQASVGSGFVSQEMIKTFLYGENFSLGSNLIAVYISNLKKKLREAQSIVQMEAWRKVGYRLVIVPVEAAPNSSCE